jgi:hypothetical protein
MQKLLFGFGLSLLAVAGMAHAQTEKQPFTITIKAETPQVKVGGQVVLDVVMTNTSDHEVGCDLYYYDSIDQNYQYHVLYEDGKPPARIVRKTPFNADPCVLQPGESRQSGGVISQIFDFRRPGKYTIQVSRKIWGDENRPGTGTNEENQDQPEVQSNTITVTVLPADSKPPEPGEAASQ